MQLLTDSDNSLLLYVDLMKSLFSMKYELITPHLYSWDTQILPLEFLLFRSQYAP